MLLRKGIHEQGGRFKVAQNQILLYPTHEHLSCSDMTMLIK